MSDFHEGSNQERATFSTTHIIPDCEENPFEVGELHLVEVDLAEANETWRLQKQRVISEEDISAANQAFVRDDELVDEVGSYVTPEAVDSAPARTQFISFLQALGCETDHKDVIWAKMAPLEEVTTAWWKIKREMNESDRE